MKPNEYVIYRIHITNVGNQDSRLALSLLQKQVPCSYCTTVIPATEKKNNGEIRSRFGTFWRGDKEETIWRDGLQKSLEDFTPVIEVALWESRATLAWEEA